MWVIVVAAGSGNRFGGAKQYAPLAGRRVLDWSHRRRPLGGRRRGAGGAAPGDADSARAGGRRGRGRRGDPLGFGARRACRRARRCRRRAGARRGPAAGHRMRCSARWSTRSSPGPTPRFPSSAVVDTVTDLHGIPVDRDALRAVQTPAGLPGRRRCGRCTPPGPTPPTTPRWWCGRWQAAPRARRALEPQDHRARRPVGRRDPVEQR